MTRPRTPNLPESDLVLDRRQPSVSRAPLGSNVGINRLQPEARVILAFRTTRHLHTRAVAPK